MLFGYIVRKLRFLVSFKHAQQNDENANEEPKSVQGESPQEEKMVKSLDENLTRLRNLLSNSQDLNVHSVRFGCKNQYLGAVIFFDGMISDTALTDGILRPIKLWGLGKGNEKEETEGKNKDLLKILEQEVICASTAKEEKVLSDLAAGCLNGETILLVDGYDGGLIINTRGWEKRSISEPQSETVVKGPREGFTENLRTNTSLIRRKIRNEKLRLEGIELGRKTRTAVALMYLEGVVNKQVLEELKFRLNRIDVESILESGYIEEYIEDAPFSPFSTIDYSEKPDVIAGRILEGRIAILVDGTPFVLTAPMLFVESFQTSEDYYMRPLYASLMRLIRFIGFLITIFAPAVYVALTAFHHELIPTTLLFTFVKSRQGTPFPVFLEALIMIFAFEVLREAGIRLPRPVGQAISIVGALIMGEAAVNAGIAGAPMVITIAITAVTGFLVPNQNDSSSMLRVIVTIPAAILGLYGVAFSFLAILVHLASLESFGIPYFDIFGNRQDLQDTLIRAPLWSMLRRPKGVARGDMTRGHFFIPPLRPFKREKEDMEENEGNDSW